MKTRNLLSWCQRLKLYRAKFGIGSSTLLSPMLKSTACQTVILYIDYHTVGDRAAHLRVLLLLIVSIDMSQHLAGNCLFYEAYSSILP